jgi:hypothetical protein
MSIPSRSAAAVPAPAPESHLLSVNYLREYRAELRKVADELRSIATPEARKADILYDAILGWQSQRTDCREAQDEINRICALPATRELQSAHPPTTAIGSFGHLVVIAANPHYHEDRNKNEIRYRVTQGKSKEWCRDFFTEAKPLTKDLAWWNSVVEFAHMALAGPECERPADLWEWAARGFVGAVDLVPFHSSADGVTQLIDCKPSKKSRAESPDAASIRDELRETAMETLKMVLAFRPRVLIIASKAGCTLASKLFDRRDAEDFWCDVHTDWVKYQYKIRHLRPAPGDRTHVFTMPSQLFSAQAGRGKLQPVLAQEIHERNSRE